MNIDPAQKDLTQFNVSKEAAEEAKLMGPPPPLVGCRGALADEIRLEAPNMIKESGGTVMFSAAAVHDYLVRHGLEGAIAECSAWGVDQIAAILGKKGLNIPRIKKGRRRYAMHLCNSRKKQKLEAQALLTSLTSWEVAALPVK